MAHISFPFRIDSRGKIAVAETPRKVWLDRVRAVINTQVGDRVMRPDFGIDSLTSVLNSGTPVERTLEEQIREAFERHLPSLTITRLDMRREPENTQIVELVFYSPDNTIYTTSLRLEDDIITEITDETPEE